MKGLPMRTAIALLAGVVLAAPAWAVYEQDFEMLTGSSGGVVLTGQDGFYLPAGSVDFEVFTYTGNEPGFPDNPTGGDQFIAGTGPANSIYARAQRDITMPEEGVFTAAYDFAATYLGTGASGQNVGSFSLRSSDLDNDFIHLLSWVDPNNPTLYNAYYLAYDAAGTQFAQPGEAPGPAWSNLEIDHWYRAWLTFDLGTNLILEIGLKDLVTGVEWVETPTGWYLEGGAGGGVGAPIAVRFFGGGSVAGNTTAFDNFSLLPAQEQGACCMPDGSCVISTEAECTGMGGGYFLPGQSCDPNPCVPIAVEQTSWGRIKADFR